MRKRVFYPKLAAGNLWRNRQTYAPYLLACAVSIFTFFSLLTINLNGSLDGIRNEAIVKSFTGVGTVILGIFCSVLIFYTNSFLIKRRKKEIGLYSILGMEKGNIGLLMLFETVFVAAAALAAGIALGLLLSRLLFWALLNMVRFPMTVVMNFSPSAALITCGLFGVIFLLAFLTNLRQVHIANPVALLSGAKQGEREPKASWLLTLIGNICLAGGYYIAVYFDSPVEALMFFLLAVLLVIIGTFCLFTSGSVMLLKALRKNKKYYYQPGHFISVSGMIYRMKQNAAGLSAICILSCMVLVTVSSTVSLNVGAEDSLNTQYPYEYSVLYRAAGDADAFITAAEAAARETGVTLVNTAAYDYARMSLIERDGAFVSEAETEMNYFDFTAVTLTALEDYNLSENKNISLADNEALLLVTGGQYDRESIMVNGITYNVTKLEKFGKTEYGGADMTRQLLLVLPSRGDIDTLLATVPVIENPADEYRSSLSFDVEAQDISVLETALDSEQTALQNFKARYAEKIAEVTAEGAELRQYRTREDGRDGWYATNGGFLFLGAFFGILFMLAAALIIYYKQLSEGYDDAERFEILQKVGMSEQEVKRTIDRQILAVFFMPLMVALLHITVAFVPVSRVMIIFGVVNTPLLAGSAALTALVYIVVYYAVFRRTARTYFGIVRRAR